MMAVRSQTSRNQQMTPREIQIALMVVDGMTNKEIAQHFSISESAVKTHITSVFKITDFHCRSKFIVNYWKNKESGKILAHRWMFKNEL